MSLSMYDASVPLLQQMLKALSEVLGKAAEHAVVRRIEPGVLLQSRLYPDMFPLSRQVQIACDFAKGVAGRLAGAELPNFEDTETSLEELQQRIAKTLAFIDGLSASVFDGSENLDIVLRPGTAKERKLAGRNYLLNYGLPQFFFHVTTAYALLRHNGVEIGKKDYMGAY